MTVYLKAEKNSILAGPDPKNDKNGLEEGKLSQLDNMRMS